MTPRLVNTPVLETERLILRAPDMGDWDAYSAFLSSPRSAMVGGPIPRDKAWRSFGHQVGHWALRGFGLFFLHPKSGGAALGMAGPWFPEGWPEREIGWSLFTDAAEGRGFAHEAAAATLAHAFGVMGWDTAVSYIDPANTRSAALARRLGARLDPAAPALKDGAAVQVWRHARPVLRPASGAASDAVSGNAHGHHVHRRTSPVPTHSGGRHE